MGSTDDIVNTASDGFDLLLAIKASPDSFISLNESLQFFLQAVVLIVKISHVFVKGVNFGLQIDLVSQHLLRVLFESVDLVSNRGLVLVQFLHLSNVVLVFKLVVFDLHVLVLVRFDQLVLCALVLLSQVFEVAEFAIEFVEVVLEFLDLLVVLIDVGTGLGNLLLFIFEYVLHGADPLVVVLNFSLYDLNSLFLFVDLPVG